MTVTIVTPEAYVWTAAAVGWVSFKDRQDLLGHKSGRMTTHYSAAELPNLMEAAEKVCRVGSRRSPAVVAMKQKAAGEAISNRLMSTENSGAPGRI